MPGNATPTKQAGGSGSQTQSQVKQAGEEAKQQAGDLAQRASETATSQANSQKDLVAEKLDRVAGAMERVRSEIQEQDPTIAKAASTAAEQAERFAGYLRHTDAKQMLSRAEDLARRRPAVFLGAAFAAGLALTRFAKASGGQSGQQQGGGQAQDREQAVPVAVGASGDMYTTSAGRGSTASAAASAATPPVSER